MTNPTLREEFAEIINEAQCGYCESPHDCVKAHEKLIEKALQAVHEWAEELIGEYEIKKKPSEMKTIKALDEVNMGIFNRNDLRQELREKLKEDLG